MRLFPTFERSEDQLDLARLHASHWVPCMQGVVYTTLRVIDLLRSLPYTC
jgi:hypothetical protein